MKKLLPLLPCLLLLAVPLISLAWDDCPRSIKNCPEPGICGSYIDTDEDGICDHSQPTPKDRVIVSDVKKSNLTNLTTPTANDESSNEENVHYDLLTGSEIKTKTVSEIAKIYEISSLEYARKLSDFLNIKVETNDDIQSLHDNYDLEPSAAKNIASAIKSDTEYIPEEKNELVVTNNKTETVKTKAPYNLLIPLLSSIVLYVLFFIISGSSLGKKYRLLSRRTFNFFWNTVLLLSLIPAFGFGIFMMLRYRFPSLYEIDFRFMYWHVELSVVMGIVSIMHFIQRWRQYVAIAKTSKRKTE